MKKLSAVLLSLVLSPFLLSPALAAESTFPDVSSDAWYAPYVQACAQAGLMIGDQEGNFNPDGAVNVDEALVMAARLLWQADGGTGSLPRGSSAEEFLEKMGEDAQNYYFLTDPHTAEYYSTLWSWDGVSYLLGRAHEEGVTLQVNGLTYPASRSEFFHAVTFACGGMELPAINEITAVPGTRSEEILSLYQAGILTGTDAQGSFDGPLSLTRAECAAILARITQPELRLTFTPQPAGYNYTLTYLADGIADCGVTYPICALGSSTPNQGHEGLLLLDGTLLPWPGSVPSFGLMQAGEYCLIAPWNESTEDPYDTTPGVLDRDGNWVVPIGLYDDIRPVQGGFLACAGTGVGSHWYLLDQAGQVTQDLGISQEEPEQPQGSTWESPALESWGGLAGCLLPDGTGGYFMAPDGSPVSEWFDWVGVLGPDGAGFVGLEGKIYRIQFGAQT